MSYRKRCTPELGRLIQGITDKTGKELLPEEIWKTFESEYLIKTGDFELTSFKTSGSTDDDREMCHLEFKFKEKRV